MQDKLSKIYEQIKKANECSLGPRAYRDTDAQRIKSENEDEMRTRFAVDRDRILYSGAYRRYHGKTQVFSFTNLID
jgi:dGTPase